MSRSRNPRMWVAGVCANIADRLQVDVLLVRAAFVLLALASGIGVLVYALLWLLLADSPVRSLRGRARQSAAQLGSAIDASRSLLGQRWRTAAIEVRTMSFVLIVVGAATLFWSLGAFAWLSTARLLGLATIALAVSYLMTHSRETKRR